MALNNRHVYPALSLGRREPYILNKCAGKRVLDLGFIDSGWTPERIAAGNLLHLWIRKTASLLVGVDLDDSFRHLLPPDSENYRLLFGNVEDETVMKALRAFDFDVVVAAEILEHVDNPGLFLRSVKGVMKPGASLVLSVPNGLRHQNAAYVAQGIEMVHPDHNYWYSPTTIQTLLTKNGFHVTSLAGYIFGPETPAQLGPCGLGCPGLVVEAIPVQAGEKAKRWLESESASVEAMTA